MNILCATDLLTKSDPAIERAHQLREQLGARLTLLHVVTAGETSDGTLEHRLLSANSRLAVRAREPSAPRKPDGLAELRGAPLRELEWRLREG